ncbi:hypothetical protein OG393_10910 [Streptomyces sp. NBC_01216]|uniref:hypothetical protein n=1 Tax=Streptomyces sp. NBC_01216 TaxID=2903778 RepID=UPI002E1054DE|nr:hypothetical protein OG393_10910 [Streptomyces sp. NBC_01216]
MRPLSSRHLVTLAISAAVSLGVPEPAHADAYPMSPAAPVAARAPLADARSAAPLAAVEEMVADLLAAVASGGAVGLVPQVTMTLTTLVDQLVADALDGLSVPDLPALPPVAVPDLPALPPVPQVPVPPVPLSVTPSELPAVAAPPLR